MYAKCVILTVVLLTVAAAGRFVKTFPCQKADGTGINIQCIKRSNSLFLNIFSRNQLILENFLRRICLRSTDVYLQENIETGRYRLFAVLEGYSEDDFDIRIKAGVLLFIVRNDYAKLMILPGFVNDRNASYFYENNTLNIVFSIKSVTGCDIGFKHTETKVPKYKKLWRMGMTTKKTLPFIPKEPRQSTVRPNLVGALKSFETFLNRGDRNTSRDDYFDIIDDNYLDRWISDFNLIARNQIMLQRKMKRACLKFSNARFREVVQTGLYKLTTQLTGYSDKDFNVSVRGNILYFYASHDSLVNAQTLILPRSVDARKASYTYDNSTLDINFPIQTQRDVCQPSFGNVLVTAFVADPALNKLNEDMHYNVKPFE